jgi:glycosidase
MGRPSTRRLRAAALLCAALAASGCFGDDGAPVARVSAPGGDVWAWSTDLAGTVEGSCESVRVRGGRDDVTVRPADGAFRADVPLNAGRNRITVACAEGEPSRPVELQVRMRDVPRAEITPTVSGRTVVLDGTASAPSPASGAAVDTYEWKARPGNPAALRVPAAGDRVEMRAPARDGEYYVSLTVADQAGATDTAQTYFVVEGGRPRIPDYDAENPAWTFEAVGYGVLPLLFGDGTPLQEVTAKLDYLERLGVNLLWLPPVMETAIGEEYAITDYFGIKDEFGAEEDVRQLIDEAHRRGMRVILDFVPNHSSIEHPYFQDTVERKRGSRYWDWYMRDEQGNYQFEFDYDHLPNLNYDNPEVRNHITEAFEYWVREFDADGFRVDAAWGVKQRRPDYWPAWRRDMKRIKPDLLLLAEASARDPYYVRNGWDAAYDWTDDLGQWAWVDAWRPRNQIAQSLVWALTNDVGGGYHRDSYTMRFLNNNDTDRFIANWGTDITRIASTLQLTIHGLPMLHTGDELGALYHPYGDSTAIAWKDRVGLKPHYERLIQLRHELPSLWSQTWHLFPDPVNDNVLAYIRSAPGHAPVLVVLSPNPQPRTVRLEIPARYRALAGAAGMRDVLNDEDVAGGRGATVTVRMQPFGARVLVPAGQEGR